MQVEQDGQPRSRPPDPLGRGRRRTSTLTVLLVATLALGSWWWLDGERSGPSWLTGAPMGLEVPEDGQVAADHLDDGTPVFVSHVDGEVTVIDARLPGSSPDTEDRPRRRVGYCPSSGNFEDPEHGSVFGRDGRWNGGPAPGSLAIHPHERVDGRVVVVGGPLERDRPGRSTTTTRPPPTGPGCADGSTDGAERPLRLHPTD